jgi:hypothetical protein
MPTCPLNSSLSFRWIRLIWMVGEALDVGGGDSHARQIGHQQWQAVILTIDLPVFNRDIASSRNRPPLAL